MRVIAVDVETALTSGEPSVQYYRDDFRVVSCAFAWRGDDGVIRQRCVFGERAIAEDLGRLKSALFVVHNLQFEQAVITHRFPGVQVADWTDTMRLVQNADNGGETGFSLQASVKRWLPVEHHDHKEPFYAKIREQRVKRGKEGASLHLLSREDLAAYNCKDAVVTLHLYERLVAFFNDINHDWTIDHELYKANVPLLIKAESRGVLVDRTQAQQAVAAFSADVARLERDFLDRFAGQISTIEQRLRGAKLARYKTERGRLNAALDDCVFNIGSTQHLAELFCKELGMGATFKTEKGAPSFGKAFLGQWGEGGKMLEKRRGLLVARQQAEALIANSDLDGRWHWRLKAVGTRTGRMAGNG